MRTEGRCRLRRKLIAGDDPRRTEIDVGQVGIMPVLTLMYHHTPKGAAEGFYDVPMPALREQIERLIDAGVRFVRLSEANSPASLSGETMVALTFDDGHASNAAAFENLHSRGIFPAAMIVRDWSKRDPDFLSARTIKSLASACEFGAHGASHVALSSLDVPALDEELSSSRAYLEDILGNEVRTMALPGGMGSTQVRRRALAQGYRLIWGLATSAPRKGESVLAPRRDHKRNGSAGASFVGSRRGGLLAPQARPHSRLALRPEGPRFGRLRCPGSPVQVTLLSRGGASSKLLTLAACRCSLSNLASIVRTRSSTALPEARHRMCPASVIALRSSVCARK